MVQKKNTKTPISLKKVEGIINSCNKINPRNKTCWKIMVRLNKINIHHC